MSKHTPGPWRLIDETGDEIAITTDDRMAEDIVSIVEVQIGWNEPLESEQQANARLIAASPELLEACQAAYIFLANIRNEWPGRHTFQGQHALCVLRDSIAKARGLDPQDVQDSAQSVTGAQP